MGSNPVGITRENYRALSSIFLLLKHKGFELSVKKNNTVSLFFSAGVKASETNRFLETNVTLQFERITNNLAGAERISSGSPNKKNHQSWWFFLIQLVFMIVNITFNNVFTVYAKVCCHITSNTCYAFVI